MVNFSPDKYILLDLNSVGPAQTLNYYQLLLYQ